MQVSTCCLDVYPIPLPSAEWCALVLPLYPDLFTSTTTARRGWKRERGGHGNGGKPAVANHAGATEVERGRRGVGERGREGKS